MKKIATLIGAALCTLPILAQPQLTKDNIDEILSQMTLQEKATLVVGGSRAINIAGVPTGTTNLVPGAAGVTRAIPRLGVPQTVVADGPAGLRITPRREGTSQTFFCTGFPVGTLLASSWDTALVQEVTSAMGNEVLEYGVDVLLAPGMNIHRNPLCGRNFEYFSEDPVLSGMMAAAYVNGIQSNGVGTSIKHYAANSQETNRNENDAQISVRALREIYLKNFEIAIKNSDPWTVMSSYNKLNGEYTQQSYGLLTSILREDFGFKGIVMTDWGVKEGTVKAVQAGNDLMEPGNEIEVKRIIEAVENGTLDIADLDRNCRRMLEYVVRTPRFAGYQFSNNPDLKAHAQVARKAAGESMVLLRNENGALPLAGGEKVALFGLTSIDFVAGGTGSGNVNKPYVVNMVEGLTGAGFEVSQELVNFYKASLDVIKAQTIINRDVNYYNPWADFGGAKAGEVAISPLAAVRASHLNDVAVVVLGRNAGEGADRTAADFNLSQIERDLLESVSDAFHTQGKKVIVVLNIGGVIETQSWKHLADAILLPWSPGQEGANAVADVLSGKVNPSGKLPMTFPVALTDHESTKNFPTKPAATQGRNRQPQKNVDYTQYEEGIWVGYRLFDTYGKQVSYPFGYGLSYTSFAYSKPVVKAGKNGLTATVTVTNTGKVAGKEAVQVYVSAPAGGLDKPAKELKAFAKTAELQPGQSQTLTFEISNYDLASFNETSEQWEAAAGVYTVSFAASVADVRCKATYKLAKQQTFQVANPAACFPVK